ncbi:MAG: hypothetical protein GEV08_01080 [Acidimicrobiia bacterium]|nr:hypothetical protein [Acidimicrobiia bacterium]
MEALTPGEDGEVIGAERAGADAEGSIRRPRPARSLAASAGLGDPVRPAAQPAAERAPSSSCRARRSSSASTAAENAFTAFNNTSASITHRATSSSHKPATSTSASDWAIAPMSNTSLMATLYNTNVCSSKRFATTR